jgi:hypothetical protein
MLPAATVAVAGTAVATTVGTLVVAAVGSVSKAVVVGSVVGAGVALGTGVDCPHPTRITNPTTISKTRPKIPIIYHLTYHP